MIQRLISLFTLKKTVFLSFFTEYGWLTVTVMFKVNIKDKKRRYF